MTYSRSADRILLVEGQDDKHMVWQLCDQNPSFDASREYTEMSVTLTDQRTTFQIVDKGNSSELLKSVPQEVVTKGRKTVGVMIDTDADLEKRWDQLVECFGQREIALPQSPKSAGTIILPKQDYMPRVGIWLMPDNVSQGELEDFAIGMIPSDDDVWELSQRFVDSIPNSSRKFQPNKISKAKLYAWLATRKEPCRMGAAVGTGDLEPTSPPCRALLTWLTDLFRR